jgi:cell wall-associated NlpC family hydrolase|nr:MAG TPA: cell wall peptidase [Caudoviricetes sp.]
MTDGENIAAAARTWLGTPHVNQARVKGIGVDCGMLLIGALEDAGLIDKGAIKIAPYSNEWHLHHSEEWFLSYVKKYCIPVTETDMAIGDFLMYQFGRCVSHGGIYIGDNQIIHAVIDQGVILSDLNDVMFLDAHGRSRLRGIYRFKGVK